MLKLKDLLEVIEEGSLLHICDWSHSIHRVVYNGKYHLEDLPKYNDHKVISLNQNGCYISINIMG